jgi:N-acyl-D-amino-acid deacylase
MANTILLVNGVVVDGTGAKPRRSNIRIVGDTITEVSPRLQGRDSDSNLITLDLQGKMVAPGFIDTHSHADRGLLDSPNAETQIRQGITTAVVGQDGGSNFPLTDWFRAVEATKVALNIASFVGHGTVRGKILGENYQRKASLGEVRRMQVLVDTEMRSGALGLSSGLEYNPGLYSETSEIIELAKVAARHGGIYISHVRDEEDTAIEAFRELIEIAESARVPAQISHIKLALAPVWGKSGEVFRMMEAARGRGVEITADVYPYTYWQSNITVLLPPKSDVFSDIGAWKAALDGVGGAQNILLTNYTPEPSWSGKTLAQVAQSRGMEAVRIVLEMMTATEGKGATVVVTAMQEKDLKAFIAHPRIMFCSDGGLRSTHPRGAGSYPRILGKYVREERFLSWEEAIRKMTSFPAERLGLKDRGVIAPGKKADLVVFDPRTVRDTATTRTPQSPPQGILHVLVNGEFVLREERPTGTRPGRTLHRNA